jgi:uncharacterized protein
MKKFFNKAKTSLTELFKQLMNMHYSPARQAFSVSCGVYIAFSPFVGLHTLMTICLAWAFRLNGVVMMGVSWLINNPLTMVPVYLIDYLVGLKIVGWLGIENSQNPVWMQSINDFLKAQLNLPEISVWAFLIGGNILGIVAGIVIYPIVLYNIKRVVSRPSL